MGGFQGSLFSRRGFLGSSVALGSLLAAIPDAFADVAEDLAALGAKLKGDIILPASPDYEGARRTFSFNPRTGSHPRAIIRCKSEDDVIRALDYARKAGLEIAIRSGGHDVLGASTVENGIIIDLSGLDAIVADPSSGRVEIGGGVRARQLTNRLQEVGQAAALGCNPAVGVSGLTLGGGIGWLLGTSGAACDNLLRARVLTADGRFVGASAEEEPDLFWALRGGGGNFGIVTSLVFRTRPLASVIGGHLAYSGEDLRGFLEFYRDQMERAPAELVVEALIMAPSQPVIFAIVCYTGDAAGADAVLAPWRKFRPLLADSVGVKPLSSFSQPAPEVAKLFQGPPPDPAFKDKRPDIYWMGGSLAALTDGAIDSLVFAAKDGPPGWDISLGHHMHGAICDVAEGETAFIRRRGAMTYHFDSYWFDDAKAQTYMGWVDRSMAAMRAHAGMPTYINYLGDNAPAAIRASYGRDYARLAQIKARLDPQNIFHRNRNINPAA